MIATLVAKADGWLCGAEVASVSRSISFPLADAFPPLIDWFKPNSFPFFPLPPPPNAPVVGFLLQHKFKLDYTTCHFLN